jgi:hypothetical protein
MSDLNKTRTKDELLSELDIAKASYNSAEIGRLETELKQIEKQEKNHQATMKGANQMADQEKIMKMEELTNLLQDKPENAKDNAETIVNQAKIRLQQTIDRYISKIKEVKNTNAEEVTKLKEEIKKEKENYENAKNYFLGKIDYKTENLPKISTKWIRFGKKEIK